MIFFTTNQIFPAVTNVRPTLDRTALMFRISEIPGSVFISQTDDHDFESILIHLCLKDGFGCGGRCRILCGVDWYLVTGVSG